MTSAGSREEVGHGGQRHGGLPWLLGPTLLLRRVNRFEAVAGRAREFRGTSSQSRVEVSGDAPTGKHGQFGPDPTEAGSTTSEDVHEMRVPMEGLARRARATAIFA